MDTERDRRATGLVRPRLLRLALDADRRRVCSIVAPAGFGKTTLVHDIVAGHQGPFAWVAVAQLAAGSSLLAIIDEQLHAASVGNDQRTPLIAIDDTHLLAGTPGACELGEVLTRYRGLAHVVLAGRLAPPIDLSAYRLDDTLCEIGVDDLRFRSWEVEELFNRVYRSHFPPSELATLAALTDGWAAVLQLYRHATKRSSDALRRQQLNQLRQSRLETVRSYLASNVLDELDDSIRSFVLGACVLGRMNPRWCNRLLDRIDGQRCLDRLVDLQLFTTVADDGTYRFHDIFRSFLEGELTATTAPERVTALYMRAGQLLEDANLPSDALRAYTLAGSEPDTARIASLLHGLAHGTPTGVGGSETNDRDPHRGQELSSAEMIPDGLLTDQRVLLARARMLAKAGRPSHALAEYAALAGVGAPPDIRRDAAAEGDRLRRWLDPSLRPLDSSDWMSALRQIVQSGELTAGALGTESERHSSMLMGVLAFARGDLTEASQILDDIDPDGFSRVESVLTSSLRVLTWWLIDGLDPSDVLARHRDDADRDHFGWVARILRAALLGFPLPDDPPLDHLLRTVDAESDRNEDLWSPAIGRLAIVLGQAAGTLRPIDEPTVLAVGRSATERLRRLGADALAVWSIAARALVASDQGTRAPDDANPDDAKSHDALSHDALSHDALSADVVRGANIPTGSGLGSIGPSADELRWAATRPGRIAERLRLLGPDAVDRLSSLRTKTSLPSDLRLATLYADSHVLDVPADAQTIETTSLAHTGSPTISVRLFGSFEVLVNGVPVSLDALRPRARSVLRLLALQSGRPLHREQLIELLWSDSDPVAAGKRLHVAISSIRHVLGRAGVAVVRSGEAYLLGGNGWELLTDVAAFDNAVRSFESMRSSATTDAADAAALLVTSVYAGELVPEEGSADWVVNERTHRQRAYVLALEHLARSASERDDHHACVRFADQGLRVDRYHDGLWRLLLDALQRADRTAELQRARTSHAAMLDDLGVLR